MTLLDLGPPSVDAFGFKFQWTTNSSKHIPFDWTGPGQFAPA
jgi:hypothetical protein